MPYILELELASEDGILDLLVDNVVFVRCVLLTSIKLVVNDTLDYIQLHRSHLFEALPLIFK